MPIEIKFNAPIDASSSTALAFQAIGEGLDAFQSARQEARQQPELPSYVLDDEQIRMFGPSSEFTKKGLQILNDERLTRDQKSIGLRQIDFQDNLRKKKEPTAQESLDGRIVIDPNGNPGLIDKNGNFDPFKNARGEDPEDVAKQQEKDMQEAFKRANANTKFDARGNPVTATIEDAMEQFEIIQEMRRRISAPSVAAPALDGLEPPPDAPVDELDSLEPPETPEEFAQLIQLKMEQFDRMTPEQRLETIQGMPGTELELFLEALPEVMKAALDRAEADGDKERFMRLLTNLPLFPGISGTAVGAFP